MRERMTDLLERASNVAPYLHRIVDEALTRRQVEVLPETKIYLVSVAQDFTKPLSVASDDKPLTLAYGDSLQESNKGEKIRKLMHVGDRCLTLVGFFPSSITRRQGESGLEYHVRIGSSAYTQVGSSLPGKQPLFFELAQRFSDLTKILSDIYSPFSDSPANLAEILRQWEETGDQHAYAILLAHGMLSLGELDIEN